MAKVDGITILSLDARPQDPSLPLSIPGALVSALAWDSLLASSARHLSSYVSSDVLVHADVDDDSLQELAYTLFCAYCSPFASPSVKASIKDQLQVPAP